MLTSNFLTIQQLYELLGSKESLVLAPEVVQNIQKSVDFVQHKVNSSPDNFYGINTGFGSLCNVRIEAADLEQLQRNLVQSHACGLGDEVPAEVVRLMLLLKIKNLSLGHSGVQLLTAQRLVDFYNNDILPIIYQLGSLGASGDLAPLAHLALPLLGLGEVRINGEKLNSDEALAQFAWQPLRLAMKEGLALLNGTQFCLAYGIWAWWQAERLSKLADMIAALSADGFACVLTPFDERLHQIRPHWGQLETAKNMRNWLKDSALAAIPKTTVQDPYSFRCVPQVHGASKDTIRYVGGIFETELNSVTDNPTVFEDSDAILSGGNFHAQPLALAMDFLAIALAELGSISERRLYQLISGQRGLPPFLIQDSGLNSGMMIAQYTAASIVSQNKQLCTPASVDSIVSCNGQEDHVSMGANSGTKLYRVVQNLERLLAIELMAAAQAVELRTETTSPQLQSVLQQYRQVVPKLEKDRILSYDIQATIGFLRTVEVF